MSDWQINTPVAFLIFNRPEKTARVFAEIAKAKPQKLLVVADGPRPDRPGEAEKCAAARTVLDGVDWDCEVLKNYSEKNLGCRRRVSSGLDWVFANVKEAIILEDDCLPHPTFFRFCEELLRRYGANERVMMISGDNFQFGKKRTDYSYYFSRYAHIWGWATWRRAWKYYDVNLTLWPDVRNDLVYNLPGRRQVVRYWKETFDQVHASKIDTWDHQWTFACWSQNGVNIMPAVNLISNIGYSTEGTHTHGQSKTSNMGVAAMEFPLAHPPYLFCDQVADRNTEKLFFWDDPLMAKVLRRLKKLFKDKSATVSPKDS